MINQEEYNKGGYAKHKLSREYIEHVHSRALDDSSGRVHSGDSGRALRNKKEAERKGKAERKKLKNL